MLPNFPDVLNNKSAEGREALIPNYGLLSKDTATTLIVAAGLMLITIITMIVLADTSISNSGRMLYDTSPILGVAIFGALISAGRYFGMKGLNSDNTTLAIGSSGLSVFAYGWFGSVVLSPYEASLYIPAILITGVITIAFTLIAAAVVYTTDYNLAWTNKASGLSFLLGLVLLFIPILIPSLTLLLGTLGFFLFLFGFLFDLIYEIYLTASNARSPFANGLGIYIAFAGVFVHILQMVLRNLVRDKMQP